MKTKYIIITLIFAIIGFLLSAKLGQLAIAITTNPEYSSWCNFNAEYNCDSVAASSYSCHFGIPNFLYGMIFFFIITVISTYKLFRKDEFLPNFFVYIFWLGLMAILGSIYLYFISLFIIKSSCVLCMAVYVVNIILFLVAFMAEKFSIKHMFNTLIADIKLYFTSKKRSAIFGVLVILGMASLFYFNSHPILCNPGPQPSDGEIINIDYSKSSADRLVTGPKENPSVTILIFTDYECVFCSRTSFELKKLLEKNPDIRVIFKDYPLDQRCNYNVTRPFHQYACNASINARCAAQQGKFWQYHDLLFENQNSMTQNSFIEFAKMLELDVPQFEECVKSRQPIDKIITDIDEATALGVNATPTLFIEGKKLEGYKTAEEMQKVVDEVKLEKQKQQEEYERQKSEYEKSQKEKREQNLPVGNE